MPIEFAPKPQEIEKLDFVVCHRAAKLPVPKQPAEKVLCSKCGETVWFGLSSPKIAPPICFECIHELIKPEDDLKMFLGPIIAGHYTRGTTRPEINDLIERAIKRHIVRQTKLGNDLALVSTIFLGLDHNHWGKGPPILFETMVFGLDAEDCGSMQQRYSSWDDAETGHKMTVKKVKAVIARAVVKSRTKEQN